MKRFVLLFAALFTLSLSYARDIPHLIHEKGTWHLIVDGSPMLLLSGEVHNSTSSTEESLEKAFATVKAMGLNSVLTPVSWAQIEPLEGEFDFTTVGYTISLARKYDLKVVLLWFGTWKNGESSYAPVWVRKDTGRFFRARKQDGSNASAISPFCTEAMNADAKAFARLMTYIAKKDKSCSIITVQVENEAGVFDGMDYSPAAMEAYHSGVPETLLNYLLTHNGHLGRRLNDAWAANGFRRSGTWMELFGDTDDTKQFLLSYAIARYINHVASSGKKVYPLPMYTNAWLVVDSDPLRYWPVGGPVPKVIDLYKAAMPDVDWVSPDIYSMGFREMCEVYDRQDNPLFIPETNRVAGPAYYAFAEHDALCYSPFAIEDVYSDPYFLNEYKTLGEILPLIVKYRGTGRMRGFIRQNKDDKKTVFKLGKYNFEINYIKGEKNAHGLIIMTGEDEFVCAGVGVHIKPISVDQTKVAALAYAEELELKDGKLNTKVVLNGDQTAHHTLLYLRGRMENVDYEKGGFCVPAPWYDVSCQRMNNPEWQKKFKVSGIYRMKLMEIPSYN